MHSKYISKISSVSAIAVLLASIAMPLSAYAVRVGEPDPSGNGRSRDAGICSNISARQSTVDSRIQTKISTLNTERQARDQKITADQTDWTNKITANRKTWDTNRTDQFTKLEARAKTDAQKAAVKDLETTINAAVATHRAAHDSARTTFEDGLEKAIDQHRADVDSRVAAFRTSVDNAFQTASSNCSAGMAGTEVRSTLNSSLQSARSALQDSRASDTKVSDAIKDLNTTRKDANQKADQTFRATVQKVIATFKTAFGSNI